MVLQHWHLPPCEWWVTSYPLARRDIYGMMLLSARMTSRPPHLFSAMPRAAHMPSKHNGRQRAENSSPKKRTQKTSSVRLCGHLVERNKLYNPQSTLTWESKKSPQSFTKFCKCGAARGGKTPPICCVRLQGTGVLKRVDNIHIIQYISINTS